MELSPRAGFNHLVERVPVHEANGRIAGEMIVPYPPGVPLVVPGELMTKGVLDTLSQLLAAGCRMVGMADSSGGSIRCLTSDSVQPAGVLRRR